MSEQRLRIFDDPALPTPSIGRLGYHALVAAHGGRLMSYDRSLMVIPCTPIRRIPGGQWVPATPEPDVTGMLVKVGQWLPDAGNKVTEEDLRTLMWIDPFPSTWSFPDSYFRLLPVDAPDETLAKIRPEWLRRP